MLCYLCTRRNKGVVVVVTYLTRFSIWCTYAAIQEFTNFNSSISFNSQSFLKFIRFVLVRMTQTTLLMQLNRSFKLYKKGLLTFVKSLGSLIRATLPVFPLKVQR